ncbi:MAG: hypothetical protein Q9222_003252 [Ikaeria aurantiellina]
MPSNQPVTPVRRSGRVRQPNKKYDNSLYASADFLAPVSDEEVESWQQLEEGAKDDEFNQAQADEEANIPEEDELSSAEAISEASGVTTPSESDEDVASEIGNTPNRRRKDDGSITQRNRKHTYMSRQKRPKETGTHTRGITDTVANTAKGAKSEYLYSLFGNAVEDLVHIARSREHWLADATLPLRPDRHSTQGMRHFFSHTEEIRQMEATEGWDWYYKHGGQQHMTEAQDVNPLSAEQGMQYIPKASYPKRSIFMGPYGRQSQFNLSFLQTLALGEAWKKDSKSQGNVELGSDDLEGRRRGDGWLLNVGTGVRCVEWAPNHDGDTQYLAVSTFQPKKPQHIGHSKFSPAFTAQSFPSSIQIWSFSSYKSKTTPPGNVLDPNSPPHPSLVICTDWGDAKHLRWCPMPRAFRDENQQGKIPIGLLAAVWSDGRVRVIDVHLDQDSPQETQYTKYTSAAFTAAAPSTLCSSVTWLSPTHLAVGCTNGFLALFSIYPTITPQPTSPLLNRTPEPPSPIPLLYTPLHASYIHSLASAYPLSPHLLATTSASGHLRLTDLRSPQGDHVLSPRMRHCPREVHFHEPSQSFVSVDESNGDLKIWPLRRFWVPVNVMRVAGAMGTFCATGSVHPCIATGSGEGDVAVTNPLRKLLYPRAGGYQCTVFKHEYRRLRAEEEASGEGEGGKIRFTEGFKVQETKGVTAVGKAVEGTVTATVFEEEGLVRCASWGKGIGWGGWLAVGMGSGLVRVEDCAV